MRPDELFLGGMVTGALLMAAVAAAVWLRPKVVPRRRKVDTRADVLRELDEAYAAGLRRGREEGVRPLMVRPRQELRVVRRGAGWIGTTAREEGLQIEDCKVETGKWEGGAA